MPARTTEVLHWSHLYDEVVTTGLCTGCAGCVVACPHDVLGYKDSEGVYRPFHLEDEGGPGGCGHGDRGCTSCTRACPRFRSWEPEIDTHLFGRQRRTEEVEGISKDIILARTTDRQMSAHGQDGGLVSAILLWSLFRGYIDGALVSYLEGDGKSWKAVPGVARTRKEILASAGSRYTYSANTLAYAEAIKLGCERLALVGMGCQSSVPAVMNARQAGKPARRFALNIGLLCSKTFDDAIFEELFEARYGLRRADIVKMNIKGVFQIWTKGGDYHEIPLKECYPWTREGCNACPDFAAEHADISTGGIVGTAGWTLTIVRTDLGRNIISEMLRGGIIEGRPGDDDPAAIELLRKLSVKSRKRWGGTNWVTPGRIPPQPVAIKKLPGLDRERKGTDQPREVWIDQSACTGCDICRQVASEVFVAGQEYSFEGVDIYDVRDEQGVQRRRFPGQARPIIGGAAVSGALLDSAYDAVEACPEHCIYTSSLSGSGAALSTSAGGQGA